MTTVQYKNNYIPLVFLVLAFLIPIAASWFLYYNHADFTLKTSNQGVLVNPPIDAKNLWQSDNTKKWQIVHVSKDICDSECENILHTLNQVKKALGKNSDRVYVKQISFNALVSNEQKRGFGKDDFIVQNKVYLADPAGKIFMYYADTSDPMSILKDLKHILEVSQIG